MNFSPRCDNVTHPCRHFGISRQTFYRWQRRYDPYALTTLEERSHCPHRRRQPTWSFLLEGEVLTLRWQFPRWGKTNWRFLSDASQSRSRLSWWGIFSPNSSGRGGWWRRWGGAFPGPAGHYGP